MATTLHESPKPLSPSDIAGLSAALDSLQGNLLKSHGRDTAAHIFISFTAGLDSAREFMAALARHVTSANEQERQTERHKKNPQKNEMFTQVLISARGYAYLGMDTSGFDIEFRAGMKDAGARLADPPVAAWEDEYKPELHALLVLAHDEPEALEERIEELRGALDGIATVHVELGEAVMNEDDRPIEHFGYIDGRSQPLFFEQDLAKEPSTGKWDPSAGPKLILVRDPLGKGDDDCGSYFVFRKLEQNVRGFKEHEQKLADALGLKGEDRELAGAMVVGRFEDGTPVVLHKDPVVHNPSGPANAIENDFAYTADDSAGNKCPFIAHIRKTNPRGDTTAFVTLEEEKARRIARRGITYGTPEGPGEDLSKMPTGGVGLLFQCCNRSLKDQFEFMQHTWVNNPDFRPKGNGIDPVMGQSRTGFPPQHWPSPYGASTRVDFGFNDFVTMKGGEYFFCPSIAFLRSLAAG